MLPINYVRKLHCIYRPPQKAEEILYKDLGFESVLVYKAELNFSECFKYSVDF